jgi:hypothetical protein
MIMGVLFSRDKTTSGMVLALMRLANLPVKKAFGLMPARATPKRTKYSGEQLREIRARKGVGRPKAIMLARMVEFGIDPDDIDHRWEDRETPRNHEKNMGEWLRKPKSQRRDEMRTKALRRMHELGA